MLSFRVSEQIPSGAQGTRGRSVHPVSGDTAECALRQRFSTRRTIAARTPQMRIRFVRPLLNSVVGAYRIVTLGFARAVDCGLGGLLNRAAPHVAVAGCQHVRLKQRQRRQAADAAVLAVAEQCR